MKKFISIIIFILLLIGCDSSDTLPLLDISKRVDVMFDYKEEADIIEIEDDVWIEDIVNADIILQDEDNKGYCGNRKVEDKEVCDGDSKDCREIDSRFYSGTAVCREDCLGYDTSDCKEQILVDAGIDISDTVVEDIGADIINDVYLDAGADVLNDISDTFYDAGVDTGTVVTPECVKDSDCNNANRVCYKNICRDKCIPYLKPCDWKPSGNICTTSGFCVECQKDSDCLGTRYKCDTTKNIWQM